MSDRIPAKIQIGGVVYPSFVDTFISEVNNSNGQRFDDWGGARVDIKMTKELQEYIHDGYFTLVDYEAPWGEFEELENFCRDHDLSYRRATSAKYEYNAEVATWIPGMHEPLIITTNESEEEMVSGLEVRRAISILQSGNEFMAIKILKDLCPVIPSIPKFELVCLGYTNE